MPAVGDARERQSIRFYLIAMIFLLFDIEVAFLTRGRSRFARWAGPGTCKWFSSRSSWSAGYVYVWKKGALEWSRT